VVLSIARHSKACAGLLTAGTAIALSRSGTIHLKQHPQRRYSATSEQHRGPTGTMKILHLLTISIALLVSACSTVSTKIVELDPARKYAPTQSVEVLLQKPERPHAEIALIESSGTSEADMLNDAREKARALGADAILKLDTERMYHPPVAVYDPWYDPYYWGYFRPRFYPPYYHPWGAYQVVGGYYSYAMKAVAIKYKDTAGAK
jgi:hypothetical protein